mgnify:CR=1 FL=1
MTNIPVIETKNLRLRAPCMADLAAYEGFGASEQSKHVGGPFSLDQLFVKLAAVAGHWNLRGYGRFLVADKATDEALGIVGPYYPANWVAPEIAWTVFGDAEGRGVAYEAAVASREWAYEALGWDSVVSCISADNTRSQRLARRLGAVKEETPFTHPEYGVLEIWRHPSREALS